MPEVSHVESDLHCIRCGHNLRTLAWNARCTECGTPVEESRLQTCLIISDTVELRRLRRGLTFMLFSTCLLVFNLIFFEYVFGRLIDHVGGPIEQMLRSYGRDFDNEAPLIPLIIATVLFWRVSRAARIRTTLTNIALILALPLSFSIIHYFVVNYALPRPNSMGGVVDQISGLGQSSMPLILAFVFAWLAGLVTESARPAIRRCLVISAFLSLALFGVIAYFYVAFQLSEAGWLGYFDVLPTQTCELLINVLASMALVFMMVSLFMLRQALSRL